jgi:hypothetical protein
MCVFESLMKIPDSVRLAYPCQTADFVDDLSDIFLDQVLKSIVDRTTREGGTFEKRMSCNIL